MTFATTALLAGGSMVLASAFAAVAIWRADPGRRVENYRGLQLPAVLGLAWFGAVVAAELGGLLLIEAERSPDSTLWRVADFATLFMLLAGLLDDLRGGRERGFRAHLVSLARLRPTTGALKLVIGGGLAVLLGVLLGGGPVRVVAAALLIALATNLVNALDVRPGRALKWSLPMLTMAWLALPEAPLAILLAAAVGAEVGILPFDLAEAGMLGDAGSNPIGFVTGVGLAAVLPTWGVVLAAAAALGLTVVAETVTISRLIEAVPPLRWFDRLGRRS